ncbi:MAG TPA: DUF402 domain-containing protein [Actinomycetota bacterium]|jgi:hypothetical protein
MPPSELASADRARLEPGTAVALRELWGGRVWGAVPARVVEDDRRMRRFYVAPGTVFRSPADADGRWLSLPTASWELRDRVRDEPWAVLSFALADESSATLLLWDERWEPLGWYVNLQTPLRPTPTGFDLTDHLLDALVSIDGSRVRWKDEADLAEAVRRGWFTEAEAAAFRAEGERAVSRLVGGEPPFDRDWTAWRPDPSWTVPVLPPGWDRP